MERISEAPHVAVFPFPLQGHVTPMLQLASLLHSKGFSITVIHAELNSPDNGNHPEFNFESFMDGIDPMLLRKAGTMGVLTTILAKCREPFRSLLGRLRTGENPVVCLVCDALIHYCGEIAEELKLPWLCFRTSSPTSFAHFMAFPFLRQKGYIPIEGDRDPEILIEELPPFRLKDLPSVAPEDFELLYKFVNQVVDSNKKSSALIFNSMDELEQEALELMQPKIPAPVYFVGPLCNFTSINPCSLIQQDRTCLTWLDKQAHGSVIYVSIGSLANMDPTELVQMAHGLRDSQQPFLWVVRPGSVQSGDSLRFLNAFEENTRDQGRIVKWAPQTEVLAHPAVGGFMTHCGWNSTLESICSGKPMICRPSFGDQMVNARLVSHVWAVGLEMAGKFKSEKIKKYVNKLMDEGKEMKDKAKLLKELACKSSKTGGTSYEAANRLAGHIFSLLKCSSG